MHNIFWAMYGHYVHVNQMQLKYILRGHTISI